MNQQQFRKWQIKEGLTIYNARSQLVSTTDILAHIIRDRDLAVYILDNIDFDDLKPITIQEITAILDTKIRLRNMSQNKATLVAEQIVSAIELGRRVNKSFNNRELTQLGEPIIASAYFRDKFTDINGYEELIAAFLNGSLMPIKWEIIARGPIRLVAISPREILIKALKYNAESLLIAHNHPGGCCEPSAEDRVITNKIKEGCQFLDIRFIDHLIITEDRCYSISKESEIS